METGSKNHEVVPTALIVRLSSLRSGSGAHKSISTLAKANLVARTKNAKYDGYRLTYGGLDYLALHTHLRQKSIYSVGNQIGTGKESDIFVVASPSGEQQVLKIHRLGRISFRTVKANRDYLRHRSSASWMYMSRLAALKEYTFMQALRENGIRVPKPFACNRHTIVMELIDAFPLRQIKEVPDPAKLYAELMEMILRLAGFGLIHGDFNEFNILVKEDRTPKTSDEVASKDSEEEPAYASIKLVPYLIDFPQMVSIDHANAEMYFDRDVNCIKTFFERRFHFISDELGPYLADAKTQTQIRTVKRLDVAAEASGFSKQMAKDLEKYMQEVNIDGSHDDSSQAEGSSDAEVTDQSEDGDISSNVSTVKQDLISSDKDAGDAGNFCNASHKSDSVKIHSLAINEKT